MAVKSFTKDNNAIAPLIWALLILGGITATAVISTVVFTQPDITYNISDTGFSIAGVDISWLLVIVIVGVIILVIAFLGRRKPERQNYYRERE